MSFLSRFINKLVPQQATILIDLGTKKIRHNLLSSNTVADIRDILTKDNDICSNVHFIDNNDHIIPTYAERTTIIAQLTNEYNIAQLRTMQMVKLQPDEIRTSTSIPPSTELDSKMWQKVFTNATVLHGIKMNTNSPTYARKPLLKIRQPEDSNLCPIFRLEDKEETEVYVTDNHIKSSFVSNQFFDIGIESSEFFSDEPFTIRFHGRKLNINTKRTKFFTSCLNHPRAVIHFDSSYVEPTKEFLAQVDEIIEIGNIDEQYTKLNKLFFDYGEIYPHQITLGAHFCHTEEHSINSHDEEQNKRTTVQKNFGNFIQILVNMNVKRNTENQSHQNSFEQSMSINRQVVGGDTLNTFDLSYWKSTITDPNKWRAIKYDDCKWITSVLDQQRQEKLKKALVYYWKKKKFGHLYSRWKQDAITLNKFRKFIRPEGMTIDDNQAMYFVETEQHRVIQWKFSNKSFQCVAGNNGCGKGNNQLSYPSDVLFDKRNNCLIIADQENDRIMKWPLQDERTYGQVLIENIKCERLAMDKHGSLYISNPSSNLVKRWDPRDHTLTIVAGGNGKGSNLNQLHCPGYIFVDENDSLYISDIKNHRVMKWLRNARVGMIVAGGNQCENNTNQLRCPQGLTMDPLGRLYIADSNHRIVRWIPGDRQDQIIVGSQKSGDDSNELHYPSALVFDSKGNLYVADRNNHRIQKFLVDLT